MHSELLIDPYVKDMGYGNDNLTPNDYYIGIWRHFTPKSSSSSMAPKREESAFDEPVLIHHCGEELSSATCGDCASKLIHNANGTITYHDYFDVDLNSKYDIAYTTRAYVKVPESVIPGETRYMLAQEMPIAGDQIISGVEDVTVDSEHTTDETAPVWYDLQGIRVDHPQPGAIYIRVTPAGNTLVRYPD